MRRRSCQLRRSSPVQHALPCFNPPPAVRPGEISGSRAGALGSSSLPEHPMAEDQPAASRRGFPAEQLHLVKWDIISVFSTRFASGRLLADVKSLSRNGPLYREPRLLGGFPLRASG